MKNIIKQIIVFSENGDKRNLELDDGLNIITGDSKTGKSALIEIVDFCLFSSRSSIPKGKITDFASLFVTIFQIGETYLVIGRPSPSKGNINEAYFSIEFEYESLLENIEYEYFNDKSLRRIKNDIQTEFERHIGLSLSKIDKGEDTKMGKLSIRDTVSFLFQHQNLIANKHAIFYRFDDFNKRKRVIDAFPVLFGAVNENYYDLSRRAKILEASIKAEKKVIEALNKRKENEVKNLRDLIQLYYSMIGKTLEENLTLAELKRIGKDLPLPSKIIDDQTRLYRDIASFEKQLNSLYSERSEVEKSLASLQGTNDDSADYAAELVKLHNLQKENTEEHSSINCPLCNNSVDEINESIVSIEESKEMLILELQKLGAYTKDNTELVNRFRLKKKEINKEISRLSRSITQLTSQSKVIQDNLSKREKLIFQKGVVETTILNFLESNKLKIENKELNNLELDLREIKEKLKAYDIETFYKDSEKMLKDNMDRIANKLDFEEELKPIDFKFNLKDFSFSHNKDGKIRLDEMGSGANWLACHLSIFLSLLRLSCSNEKSVVPTTLFLDQPSQVYFPRTANKSELKGEEAEEFDENIAQVLNIFKVINEELDLIESATGIKPQIVVLEHANDDSFKTYIKKEWDKRKDQGLI